MELFENVIRIFLGIALIYSLVTFLRSKVPSKWIYSIILIIITVKVLDIYLLKLNGLKNLLPIISSNLFLAPLAYLYFLSIIKGKLTRKITIIHLILPLILSTVKLYNLNFASEENIMITILVNLISNLVVLIYGLLILAKSQFLYSSLQLGLKKSLYVLLIFTSLFLVIESLVSIISVLYFSDDLLLVHMAVDIPKTYEASFYLSLLILLCIGFIYHKQSIVRHGYEKEKVLR